MSISRTQNTRRAHEHFEPAEDGDHLYKVVVIDSTKTPHGNDSRKDGETGVGRGTLWLITNDAGQPVGYHWKLKTGKPHEMQIAIGRAE